MLGPVILAVSIAVCSVLPEASRYPGSTPSSVALITMTWNKFTSGIAGRKKVAVVLPV